MTQLLTAGVGRYAPTTNHYLLDDGRYVLITVPDDENMPLPPTIAPVISAVRVKEIETGPTVVYLSDETGNVLDADGEPANGMTPLATYPPGTSHDEALELLVK